MGRYGATVQVTALGGDMAFNPTHGIALALNDGLMAPSMKTMAIARVPERSHRVYPVPQR
ncbi:hypothetical protein [Microbulbifer sp. 2201CG32-9]|uniref:hypothetical protein n=1 Tax=unclassified Microbulbifer TaxID=2619833 RepID=UPI00345B55E1